MARNNKNKAFSYNNHEVTERNFINKNFDKTSSFNSNFSQSKFTNTSFIGSSFKWCNLTSCIFDHSLFRGALFRGGSLQNTSFNNCIINACNLEKCNLDGVILNDCYVISSNSMLRRIEASHINNSKIFHTFPEHHEFNPQLIEVVQNLRMNDFVRRSSVLHRKLNKVDTVTISYLLDRFEEDFLIEMLPTVCNKIERDFHTVSYIDKLLRNKLR